MPGCYWIGIYLDPKKISIEEMIHKTTESLLESGCTFYKVTETKPKKEMVDVPQQSYNLNDLNVDLEESINIATKTFKEIKDKHGTSISKYPGIWFTFLFDFKVDEQSRKEFEAEYPHRRINAIEFHFCFHKDEIFKTRYEICLFTEWDGIVDYGIEEFNRYNKAKIMVDRCLLQAAC